MKRSEGMLYTEVEFQSKRLPRISRELPTGAFDTNPVIRSFVSGTFSLRSGISHLLIQIHKLR
jgi:hypothetical protein